MPNHSVEVDLQFDLKDYVRASTRLMFTRPSFLILLALTGGAVLYGIYFVIINAGTMGFVAALLSQVPFLVLGLVPVVLWLSLRRQGARILARQQATGERIRYAFSDDGFAQRVTSAEETSEHSGEWDTFSRALETPSDFLLLLPKQGGVFIPKSSFDSESDVARFRDILRRNMEGKAKLRKA